jgi:hypothetical protein
MTRPEQRPATIRPWHVGLSIVLAAAALFALYWIDATQTSRPFEIREDLSLADYEMRFRRTAFEFSIWTLEQGRANFEWSQRSTRYIFWVSMLITVSGIAFAFWQFARASQFDRESAERDEVELKTQLASLSFKTRSVATLVLVVSLGYLGLYVGFLHGVEPVTLMSERPSVVPPPGITEPFARPPPVEEDVVSDDGRYVIPIPPQTSGPTSPMPDEDVPAPEQE